MGSIQMGRRYYAEKKQQNEEIEINWIKARLVNRCIPLYLLGD